MSKGFFSTIFGGRKPNPSHLCGGTTDKTDPDAPKSISSKDLTQFSASIYLDHRQTKQEEHNFLFRIGNDENGTPVASEDRSGLHAQADEKLISAVQAIIDKYKLVLSNGCYRVTAGLPPPFQASTVHAAYASGESFEFTRNNDPTAEWAEELYDLFAEWFKQKGDDSLLPQREESQITHIRFILMREGVQHWYRGINVEQDDAIDGQTYLLQRQVFSFREKSRVSLDYILFPADYYEKVTEIFDRFDIPAKYDKSRYDRKHHDYGNHGRGYYGMGEPPTGEEPDVEGEELSISIEYESGKKMHIKTAKRGELDGFAPLIAELKAYYDSLFDK